MFSLSLVNPLLENILLLQLKFATRVLVCMPSVDLLGSLLSAQRFWIQQKQFYLSLPSDRYTQQFISERLATCEQYLQEIQVQINEHLVVWAARRPPPPQQ